MSTEQHEALKLVKRFETYTHGPGDVVRAERFLRTQHALIVQMAEAIKAHKECEFTSDHPALQAALIAATQYLTRGPKT